MHLAPGEYRKNHPCSCRALFCLLAFREDDLIHKEEDDHGDAAVEHGGANVVDEVWHQQPSHRHPDAVDGVDDAGNDAERQQIPAHLICNVAFAAEHEIALDREVDALTDDHGDHVSTEVGQTSVSGIVAQNVPLEGLAEEGDVNARPAEIEDTKKWVLSPERKAPKATREYTAKHLDGVLNKFLKTMQTASARLQEALLKPEVRQKGKEQVKEKARDSVLQLLFRLQAEQTQRKPSAPPAAEKSENCFQ